jgi:hypothetical protein
MTVSTQIKIALIFFFLIVCYESSQAQFQKFPLDTATTYRFKLKDGSEFIGKFIDRDSSAITISTKSIKQINIQYNAFERIEVLKDANFVRGEYWFTNPNATRYFFGPSAINLKAGEGYYQNTYLFLNSFNVGLSDFVSIGGGLEILSTFGVGGNGPQPIFFITPKVGFPVAKKVHVGGGVLYASIPNGDDDDKNRTGLGILYGVSTYGTDDNNITGGLGWGFIDGELSEKPIITIIAAARMSRRSSFVTENWIVPNGSAYYTVVSYGIRFFGEKISVDLAFINSEDVLNVFPLGIPYVDFVVKF